ncbi:hypothetical protein TEA_003844 [Camellia sinensis var. sinensis]|uniref:Uncharacterized protein n=1 Tax=Camellia sinensis var. sinensis TaxID=542762 RepID=A0A4S4EUY7_CAMSN|nr:hypothetical protein TEA_003844 [Camellia sinensis var. sinensis]
MLMGYGGLRFWNYGGIFELYCLYSWELKLARLYNRIGTSKAQVAQLLVASTLPFANVRGLNQLKAKGAKMELSIMQPDDWHLRLRDGDLLEAVISHSAFHFGRGIVIPNLKPPFKTTAAVVAYQESILKTLPANSDFIPLMALYLTDTTTPEEIKLASEYYLQYNLHSDSLLGDSGVVYAVKLYPAGATTNSQYGATDLFGKCLPVLEEMVKHNMPLLVHGEVTDPEVDIFHRERVFIDTVLRPLIQKFPPLKVAMEHVTTADAVSFEAFLKAGALDKPEAFTSFNGPNFYGLPSNTSKIKLIKNRWKVPKLLSYATGETLEWLPCSV